MTDQERLKSAASSNCDITKGAAECNNEIISDRVDTYLNHVM